MIDRLRHPVEFLLNGLSEQSFFADYYEQAPLRCAGGGADGFDELLTIDAVDAFLHGADLRSDMIDLAKDGRRVAPDRYTSGDARIIPTAVAEAYLGGATIILPQLQNSFAVLGDLCRALEGRFSCHVQANAYLTPSGQRGLGPHHDTHDVFVLQVAGAKEWRQYERRTPAAFREPVPPAEASGDPSDAFMLRAGDSLYLPRGLIHQAVSAGTGPSLHITIGLITRTWADLILAAVADVARAEPVFASSLPPGFAGNGFDAAATAHQFQALMKIVAENAGPARALDQLARDFLHARRPSTAGIILAGPSLPRSGERYRRRPLVLWRLTSTPIGPLLSGPGGDIQISAAEGDALAVALSGRGFDPGDLNCPNSERLFRTLWANGYLERVQEG